MPTYTPTASLATTAFDNTLLGVPCALETSILTACVFTLRDKMYELQRANDLVVAGLRLQIAEQATQSDQLRAELSSMEGRIEALERQLKHQAGWIDELTTGIMVMGEREDEMLSQLKDLVDTMKVSSGDTPASEARSSAYANTCSTLSNDGIASAPALQE